MKSRTLIVGFAALLLLGAGSASVLDSFGTISGTASVEPALKISEVSVDGTDELIEVYNPSDSPVTLTDYDVFEGSSRALTAENSSEIGSGEVAVVVEEDYTPEYVDGVNYFTASAIVLADSDSGKISIRTKEGFIVDEISYTGECGDTTNNYHRLNLQSSEMECNADSIGENTEFGDSQ